MTDSSDATARLTGLLELDRLDRDLFRAPTPDGGPGTRLFGGQVAAQALRAAALTVEVDHAVHSLHGYFLRPGQYGVPLIMYVDIIRGGNSFTTRTVKAVQNGEAIFTLSASFHKDEAGPEYGRGLPDGVPDPDDDYEWNDTAFTRMTERFPFDLRDIPGPPPDERGLYEFGRRTWMRLKSGVEPDSSIHACLATFASDMGAVFAAAVASKARPDRMMGASLDHAIWFHRPIDVTEWFLYDLHPVRVAGARGLVNGAMYDRAGSHLVSVAQEALVRPLRD